MISCEKAAKIMDQRDFKQLSFKEKFLMKFHNLHCKGCRVYDKLSKRLYKLIEKEKSNPPALSSSEKDQLKKQLLKD